MILIIGTADDIPSVYVRDKILARGGQAVMFDTTRYPTETLISFDPDGRSRGSFQPEPGGPKVMLKDFISVYRRWSKGIVAPHEADPVLNEIVYWNIESAVGSFTRCLDCLWVNSAEATDMHRYKGYQLKLLKQAGIRVPETLITNDPDALVEFYEALEKKVIFKPVRGWAHTEMLSDDDLVPERLETLYKSPVKLQEFVPGTDIRAYLVKDELFAMEIRSSTLDFREDREAARVPLTLPDAVVEDCKTVARTLDLVFTGIDLRRTPDGEYVFFEANPTPVFLLDETASGYPIGDRLVDVLMAG